MNLNTHNEMAKYLDRVMPLMGASHADVISYTVDTPMRYTECAATLSDGRVVRLEDSTQFIGHAGVREPRALLFCAGRRYMVLRVVGERYLLGELDSMFERGKFIARDGSLLRLRSERRSPVSTRARLGSLLPFDAPLQVTAS